tara:strand:+ start:7309 stop:8478 length:1170 start_codon:yes stop_codon:yes gene_type:complete
LWDNFKDILKENRGIFSIGFGESAGKIISAIFWFLLAGILGPEKYGEIHYLLAIAGMAQIFALIATSQTMTVYTAKNVKIESTLILISIIAGSIAFLVIIMNFYMFDVAFLVFAFIIFELTNGILLGRRQYSIYSKYFLIQKILLFVLGIGFFYQFGFEGIIFGMALSYVPHLIIILKEMKRTKINFSLLNARKGFIINNYATVLSGSFASQIDKFIIVPILGFTILGEYSLSMQILVILSIGNGIIFKYLLPQDSIGIRNKNLKKMAIVFSIAIACFGAIILPMIIPTIFPEYEETVDAIKILSWTVIPEMLILIYTSKLLGLEKSKFVLISNIISTTVLIMGMIALGPIFGILGIVSMVLISTCIQLVILIIGKRDVEGKLNYKKSE